MAAAITEAQLRGDEKGRPLYDLEELGEHSAGRWMILTGCRKGHVRSALNAHGITAAAAELDRLASLFGHDHVAIEITDAGLPTDSVTNDAWRHLLLIMVCLWWRPTTCITQLQTNTDSPRPWLRYEAAKPGRDGRLAASAGGTPAVGARNGFAFHSFSRRGCGIRTDRGGVRLFAPAGQASAAQTEGAVRPHSDQLVA